jgi:hypothetical protein
MTETAPANLPKVLLIGPDRVTICETEAVIEAKHAMLDWDVREVNHVPVYLEDKKYFLVQKRKADAPYAVRYLLHPWPEFQASNANTFHAYGLDVVNEREASLRTGRAEDVAHAFLMPFYPLLGMFWSGAQNRLVRFGYVPHTITGASIFTVFSLFFGQGVFAAVLLNSSLRTGKLLFGGFLRAVASSDRLELGSFAVSFALLDTLLLLALAADVIFRYSLYLRDDQYAGGFFEWIVPRRKRTAVASS